jgi:hypothetical protein
MLHLRTALYGIHLPRDVEKFQLDYNPEEARELAPIENLHIIL